MIRKLTLMTLLAGVVTLSACNTLHGAKEDVHSAGKAVAKSTDGKQGD